MMHGTWYSRLTMPMCERGVPDRHTTAVSSSKIGARKVAPASATHATTPSADVSISSRTSSGELRRRHEPRTGPDSKTRVPVAISVTVIECSRVVAVTISAVAEVDDATFRLATFPLLHEIRLRGVVELPEGEIVTLLVDEGYVVRNARGVRITAIGRVTHTAWARLAAGGEDEQMARRAYERFLPLNRELLRVCTDWQLRAAGIPNDHRDARYDWSVLDRLHTVDERIAPVASRLGRTIERFEAYRPRLRAALARIDEGETEWLNSPRVDSYHTVWMQLHEDLLLAIGGDRSTELAADTEPGGPVE